MSLDSGGRMKLLSGNEAIARGAYEGGVVVGSGYPGTPSSETRNKRIDGQRGIRYG